MEKQYIYDLRLRPICRLPKIINDCGYHSRDEELVDAKKAILGL